MSFTNKIKITWVTSFLVGVALFPTMASGESFNSKISQAMDHYQQEEYDQAAKKFLSAELDRPNSPAISYNLANSNYMSEKYEDALEAYTRAEASATNPTTKQKALYNMGNSLYRMGKAKEAAEAYKKALELDPSDMDAKYNLEFVRQELKKKNQKQDKENKESRDQPSKDEKDNKKEDQNAQGDNKDENDQQEPSDKQDPNKEPKEPDEQSNPPAPNKGPSEKAQNNVGGNKPSQAKEGNGELSEEEAERWLNSLTENNKKFNKNQSHANMNDVFNYQGNDW
jgi:Ca-activated chloride channel family protein